MALTSATCGGAIWRERGKLGPAPQPVARQHGSGGARGEPRCSSKPTVGYRGGGGATVGELVGVRFYYYNHQPLSLTLETKKEFMSELLERFRIKPKKKVFNSFWFSKNSSM